MVCILVIFISTVGILAKAGVRLPLCSAAYLFELLSIAKCPTHWTFFMIIPVINIYFFHKLCISLAYKFGKDKKFGTLLTVLPMIYFPILAFDNSKYIQT